MLYYGYLLSLTVTVAFVIPPGAARGGLQSSCMVNQQRGTLDIWRFA